MIKSYYRSYQSRKNNEEGRLFEQFILNGCQIYADAGRAYIGKTPEPFRVKRKNQDGTATVYFIQKAEPDFKGVLAGGRCIVFEAKYTSTNRLRQNVITATQEKALTQYTDLGALAGVVGCVQDVVFFMPWKCWQSMQDIYGRRYLTAVDVEPFRVRFIGAALFLDYVHDESEREVENGD